MLPFCTHQPIAKLHLYSEMPKSSKLWAFLYTLKMRMIFTYRSEVTLLKIEKSTPQVNSDSGTTTLH